MKTVIGHGLEFEGAPHDDLGRRLSAFGVGGRGRARCQCGVMSDVLPSSTARREWHRRHKENVVLVSSELAKD